MQQFYQDEKRKEAEEGKRKGKKRGKRQRLWLHDKVTETIDPDARGSYKEYTEAVDVSKSADAISPNVIHAMDATHLMMTVLTCKDAGVNDLMGGA